MLLKGKNAVIYGAGGHIGSAVARAFAFPRSMIWPKLRSSWHRIGPTQ